MSELANIPRAGKGVDELLERLHQELIIEAALSARTLQRLDQEARSVSRQTLPIEELLGALATFPEEVADIEAPPVSDGGGLIDHMALMSWTSKVINRRASGWKELNLAVERLAKRGVARALEAEINRLRLFDSLRENSRCRAELAAAVARIAALEHVNSRVKLELADRERLLAHFGHQFVSRIGAILDPYPRIRGVLTAPLRLLYRMLGRSA